VAVAEVVLCAPQWPAHGTLPFRVRHGLGGAGFETGDCCTTAKCATIEQPCLQYRYKRTGSSIALGWTTCLNTLHRVIEPLGSLTLRRGTGFFF
jgi:hypothetical protein